jgi:hypothetical protein
LRICLGKHLRVNFVKRRLLLSLAALSPGVVTIALQEFAVSVVFTMLGLFGAIGIAAVAVAASPQIKELHDKSGGSKLTHQSLLVPSALADLRETAPDPMVIRSTLQTLMIPTRTIPGFATEDEKIAMVLAQIMARWEHTEPLAVSDDQARELWLVERLMRASPAEAGALAGYFAAPIAMLTMRDRIAAPVPA